MPAADLAIEWMDYDTLARRFGIERESARQKAKRGRWARRRDNAGGRQVGVRANGLQQQLDTARDEAATAEKARAIAAQVEALNTVLAVERERLADERARVDEWKAVADRFALQAEALAARPSRFFGWFRRWASG